MRIFIKGGVWKNAEDEILKAAVMKYGKNQWSRISSLLVRKSAKQCKARWYEWLDPSIKKTEWTRDEDEKLLHLAKLMPTQWRTIAPIVGRTATQCLERYEKLLDAAAARDERYEAADDPRRLRPGEIDPNPEAKPARPDPVDMDEDEKEMLSEARARLANTKGKKAKRKAREKQLEEAKRLASLQKRRELKAAGMETRQHARKAKGIDYATEIPLEKRAPAGFYDVSEEDAAARASIVDGARFTAVSRDALDGRPPRGSGAEAALMKRDAKMAAVHARHDTPAAVAHAAAVTAIDAGRKRSTLMLPPPQLSESQLESLARGAAHTAGGDADAAGGAGGAATAALLGGYGGVAASLPLAGRTPLRGTGGGGDAILTEAAAIARLSQAQTPLLGGEGPSLDGADFGGATPRRASLATPHPMATPARAGAAAGAVVVGAGATPRLGGHSVGVGAHPGATPLRDALIMGHHHLDGSDGDMTPATAGGGGRRADKARAVALAAGVRASLATLPAPRHEYTLEVPDLPRDHGGGEDDEGAPFVEDAADAAARITAQAQAAASRVALSRSAAVRRGLPRPSMAASHAWVTATTGVIGTTAEAIIGAEAASLAARDAWEHPYTGAASRKEAKAAVRAAAAAAPLATPRDDVDLEDMAAAAVVIAAEADPVITAAGGREAIAAAATALRIAASHESVWMPAVGAWLYGPSPADRVESAAAAHAATVESMERDASRVAKLEARAAALTGGHAKRAGEAGIRACAAQARAVEAHTALVCYRALHTQEQAAAAARVEDGAMRRAGAVAREVNLQSRYGRLVAAKADLEHALRGAN